jgi:hypothetical protein
LKRWMRPRRADWSPQFPLAKARIITSRAASLA